MNRIILLALLVGAVTTNGQTQSSILAIDFVKVKDGKRQEAMYFYENNWKVYREIAKENGFIKSWQLLTTHPDTTANFDLMLITEYADSVQASLSEDRFQKIIKETNPNGPKLLNDLKPVDFRANVFFKRGRRVFGSSAGL
jgi:hypothetical protein